MPSWRRSSDGGGGFPRPIHSLRFPRLPRQLLLAPLEADEDPVRLVEEFPQGLDVDVLIPADHEDAGGARPSLPATCNTARQRPGQESARPGPPSPRAGDPPLRPKRVSHTSTSAGPQAKHSCLADGSAPGTTCEGTAVRQRRPRPPHPPTRPARPGPARPSPAPHHQRWLRVQFLHGGGGRAPLTASRLPARREAPPRLPASLPALSAPPPASSRSPAALRPFPAPLLGRS